MNSITGKEDLHNTNELEPKPKRRSAPWFLGSLVLLLLTALVALQVAGLWEVFTPDTAADTLVLYALSSLNFVAFFIFAFIFIRNLLKLRRERRERQLGSKVKTRLVVYFITVSLLPITAMALFSYIFLNRSLEKWFGRLPEDVVQEAQQARREEAQDHERRLQEITAAIGAMLDQRSKEKELEAQNLQAKSRWSRWRTVEQPETFPDFGPLVDKGEFASLALVAPSGEILVRGDSSKYAGRVDELNKIIEDARQRVGGVAPQLARVDKFNVALMPLNNGRMLVAAQERHASSHLDKIVAGSRIWDELRNKQKKVRLLGLSTLGLLTLMLLFAATWSAIHLARGISTPIRAMAEAADQVAGGNLNHHVSVIAQDELALLVESFNQMTEQLAENRRRIEASAAELREKNLALAERRDYIETVLQSLSTGIISLDAKDHVTTINLAAISMLQLESPPPAGTPLIDIVCEEDYTVLGRVLVRARLRGRALEQTELVRGTTKDEENGGQVIPVALTATALDQRYGKERGVVLMMEDLSELLAAQRAAAWSEVARRMAHEIKNPLTPIQLSAERIARNFRRLNPNGEKSASAEALFSENGNGHPNDSERVGQVVEECTATIVREVAGLKAMVDEFARFARLPHVRLELADLNEVARQAIALYEERLDDVRMDVRLAHSLPSAMLDAEQLRRVFVNLIDNALEALAKVEGEKRVTVATGHDPARGLLLAEVVDTGHGIAPADFPRLFQPYFSTRGRGTGLGLAIVQRIITEHGGRIRAEMSRPRGARFIFELPVAEDARGRDQNGESEINRDELKEVAL